MERAEEDFPSIKARFLLSINRMAPVSDAEEILELFDQVDETYREYMVGVELSGDPRSGSFSDFEPIFDKMRSRGIKISLHCAETEDQIEESQKMIEFKPDRLGHCCFLNEDQLKWIHEQGIPVEVCPTSNLAVVKEALNEVGRLPHLKVLQDLNARFSICCDDTMLFSTNISTELFEYAKGFRLTGKQLKERMELACEAIFDDTQKEWLLD